MELHWKLQKPTKDYSFIFSTTSLLSWRKPVKFPQKSFPCGSQKTIFYDLTKQANPKSSSHNPESQTLKLFLLKQKPHTKCKQEKAFKSFFFLTSLPLITSVLPEKFSTSLQNNNANRTKNH